MKAFDTDILTEILLGNPAYAQRIANVPLAEQAVSIVAVEEIIRGRLNTIRHALMQKLGKLDTIFVVDTIHDRAAWFNFGPEADIRVRRMWSRTPAGARKAG